jgi:predicted dienelactone hydrolase
VRHVCILLGVVSSPALAVLMSLSTAALAVAVAGDPSPDEPVVLDTVLRDPARGKDLELRLVYPASGERHPVVLFSHGAGGSREGVDALGRVWAAHGYVVVAPTHADSIVARRRAGESPTLRDTLQGVNDLAALRERALDLRFLLDSLARLEETLPALRGRLDRKAVGVAGHSMGALTAVLLGGARAAGGGDLSDPRPLAFVLLSPQGEGPLLGRGAWDGLKRPTLFMTGSQDRGLDGQPPEWRRQGFDACPAGDKHLVFLEGATHLSFTGRLVGESFERAAGRLTRRLGAGGAAPRLDADEQRAIWDAIGRTTIAFWDAYLRRTASGQAALAALRASLGPRAEVRAR